MMKIVLIVLTVIVGFFVGYLCLASGGVKTVSAPGEPAVGTAGVEAAPEASLETGGDTMISHLLSAAFGIFAAFLLVTKSENNAITLFSIAVLSTLFGRYLGPLVLPDFF